MAVQKVTTRAELIALKRALGVRDDWHEPDEQGVDAVIAGKSFDNAGFWPAESNPFAAPEVIEQYVIICRGGQSVAVVNLATLFSWATGYDDDVV